MYYFLTAIKTPPPVFLSGLSRPWISYSQAKRPASPISPSALSGFSHVSVIITISGLVLSTRFWNLAFFSKIDCAFTFKTFRCVGAFLFFLPLCVVHEGSGEDVACVWPGEPDVLDVVKVPELSSRFMFDSDSAIVPGLKFGIMQRWQSHITEDRSMSAYRSECMFWHSMWYHTRHWSQQTAFMSQFTSDWQTPHRYTVESLIWSFGPGFNSRSWMSNRMARYVRTWSVCFGGTRL